MHGSFRMAIHINRAHPSVLFLVALPVALPFLWICRYTAPQVDVDRLGWWLCERQTPSGGFNGRPEKARPFSKRWKEEAAVVFGCDRWSSVAWLN